LTKPFDNLEEIEIVVEKALMEKALMDENQYLKNQLNMDFSFEGIIGKSKGIQRVIDLVKKLKGEIVEIAFIIELKDLKGRSRLKDFPVYSMIQY